MSGVSRSEEPFSGNSVPPIYGYPTGSESEIAKGIQHLCSFHKWMQQGDGSLLTRMPTLRRHAKAGPHGAKTAHCRQCDMSPIRAPLEMDTEGAVLEVNFRSRSSEPIDDGLQSGFFEDLRFYQKQRINRIQLVSITVKLAVPLFTLLDYS